MPGRRIRAQPELRCGCWPPWLGEQPGPHAPCRWQNPAHPYPGAPEGDAEAFLKPSTVHDAFAQDLSEADRWLIVGSQRPITLGANTAPTQTAAWKTIPSWAVVGTEDRVIPPATQRSMAERAGSIITEVAGSHVSMVSHPAAAIEAILAAVAAISD
jgi:pimeloyl-ACP methyl ester carboxylesterase